MAADNDELMQLRISTEPFAANGELDAFLEIWGRNILRMEMEAVDGHALQLDLLLRCLPDFAMASGSLSRMRNRHTAALIDNDDFVLVVVEKGAGEHSQHGRVTTVADGQAVLTANGAPATFLGLTPGRVINYRLSRNLLRPHIRHIDDLVGRPIARNDRVLQLLVSYAGVLNDVDELATPALRRAVSAHMHDLAALLLGSQDVAQLGGGLSAARLKAVKDEILRRLVETNLSVDEIAKSQQISERYLRKLFAAAGTTFTDFVREARLVRAYRMLTDLKELYRPIHAIAYGCGFGDLSYFNRIFRQRYNMTPSDARERARRARTAGA